MLFFKVLMLYIQCVQVTTRTWPHPCQCQSACRLSMSPKHSRCRPFSLMSTPVQLTCRCSSWLRKLCRQGRWSLRVQVPTLPWCTPQWPWLKHHCSKYVWIIVFQLVSTLASDDFDLGNVFCPQKAESEYDQWP